MGVAAHASAVPTDKAIMRLVFLAFAVHAYTDNVLIATTACVFFTFAAAVFARDRVRARPRLQTLNSGPFYNTQSR